MSKEEMIEEIKKMTVVELADLVKAIEEEFGVSAVAAAAPAAGAGAAAAAEEKTSFDVVLKEAGANKTASVELAQAVGNENVSTYGYHGVEKEWCWPCSYS